LSVVLVLAAFLLFPVTISYTSGDVPEGCEQVFAATSRGGASRPSGWPGCTLVTVTPSGVVVERVIDGDTITIAGGDEVRYIGLDSPETYPQAEPFGAEATRFNRDLVEGRRVRLEVDVSDRDRFGRLLRYVYLGDILVNAELVREGYAEAVAYPPDTRYQRCLSALQDEAQAEARGMWRK
jgi:micrococcal nuclease